MNNYSSINFWKKGITAGLVLLSGTIGLHAQQLSNPALNTRDILPPGTQPTVPYYGLENLTDNDKFNYIRTRVPDVPLPSLPATGAYARTTTDYFDGLGRPLQSVAKKAHADGNDIVSVHTYDNLGRETYQYLPYAAPTGGIFLFTPPGNIKLNCKDQMRNFYDEQGADEQPYSKTLFDNSPLNRVTKQMAPGRSWVGSNRGVTYDYKTNSVWQYNNGLNVYSLSGGFPRWTIANTPGAIPVCQGDYAAGQLYIASITDEDGKSSLEMKDKQGRVMLKLANMTQNVWGYTKPADYAYTCYVYDDLGRLRCVIPPLAAKPVPSGTLGSVTWPTLTQAQMDGLCYSYVYDNRSRLIEQKVPGKAVEFYVYDKRDRQVLYQDGNMRAKKDWAFTVYDAIDRPIINGYLNMWEVLASRSDMQGFIDNATVYTPQDVLYYLKKYDLYQVYPSSLIDATIVGYTYYDNYNQLQNFTYDGDQFNNITLPPNGTVVPSIQSSVVRGFATGSKIRLMDPDSPTVTKWLASVNYYDAKGRVIQNQSQNLRGGTDISSNIYFFQGMLWKNIMRHQNPTSLPVPGVTDGAINNIVVVKTFERNLASGGGSDQVYRVTQKIGNGIVYDLAWYDYDHLGRSTVKQFTAANVLQEYNMRGFLNHIEVANFNNDPATNQTEQHIFEENLFYDKGFGSKLYNGNIAGITWKKAGAQAPIEAYGYSYDNLNRLNHAEYKRAPYNDTNNWSKIAYDYTTSNITYDLNGNIQTMNQRGLDLAVSNNPINMDQLVYNYTSNNNQLIKVSDAVPANGTPTLPDFKDKANYNTEYGYDPNGNMVADSNKKITSITYSYLNKPERINVKDSGKITYVYDAAGNRLQKKVFSTVTNKTQVYDYIGNFVYKDSILQYILNEEGRTRPIPVAVIDPNNPGFTTKFVYDYFVKDHLGNVRSNVTAEPIDGVYRARHEIVSANIEQLVFDNIPNVRANKPGSTAIDDAMAARLDGAQANTRIGTAIMLKTMPGDRFNISVDAFYEGQHVQTDDVSTEDVVSALLGTLTGGANYAGVPIRELPESMRTITTALGNPELVGQLDNLLNSNNNVNAPKAHLNYLFFNDKMELVASHSGSVQVPTGITGWTNVSPLGGGTTGVATNWIVTPSSGFILVYIDNQSIGKEVWFDNLMVGMYKGVVTEETHYYPFGLAIQTSQATGALDQTYKYNTIELEKRFGLEMYDALYRNDDPQLGRFWQIDPKFAHELSPYSSRANNPVLFSDPLGDTTQVYGRNGILIGTVNDKMKNQIHFLSIDGDKDAKPWTLSSGKTVDANATAAKIRAASTAFLGENSAKSLKEIAMRSANISDNKSESGRELGFYGVISKSKEIIFKEFDLPEGVKGNSDSYPIRDAMNFMDSHGGNSKSLYTWGHTHTKGWNYQLGNAGNKEFDRNWSLEYYGKPSGSPGSVDYINPTGKKIPLIIASPVGVTIYSSDKYYDKKLNVVNYNSFKK
jgi:RHS repeat-associated protein